MAAAAAALYPCTCLEKKLAKIIKISIVDDDESVREALVGLMKSHGYAAEAYESGARFLAANLAPDCLIADMHMPGMTGLELHGRLIAAGMSTPTILITARRDEDVRKRALAEGISCYLTKPFKEEHLLGCILSALKGRDPAGR
jgi:FixJ family two-component response regulator